MISSTLARIERAARGKLAPPPRLKVADWLDANRVVGREYPSPFPGPWRTSRTPYLRQPLNDFVDPAVEVLILLFSSQIGKSEMLLGTMLYAYGVDPGPGMLVLPTLELASSVSTDRLSWALQSCPGLVVGSPRRSRTTDDAILHKRINGLPLTLAGANSPASLSARPCRYLWADEIDRWPHTTPEGDPLSLARQRTAAYRRRKTVLTSTPTIKGASRIEDWYGRSDQRELWSPCPRCAEIFVVEWCHVRWNAGKPASAYLQCPQCEGQIEDRERAEMIEESTWYPTVRNKDGANPQRAADPEFNGIRGYRTWAVVSPWTSLPDMVASFLAAKQKPETLQSWVNLTRGESWEVQAERVESAGLLMRREEYPMDVPAGARVLTAGVDTQDDRLEALVVGWGAGEEAWVVARESFYGDPQNQDVWGELDEMLLRAWAREAGGATRVQCALVDALGHRTAAVYTAIVARQHRRVFASIGRDGGDAGQIVSSPKTLATKQGNVLRHVVDASQVKELIYSRLNLADKSGPGVIHFPMTVGDAFFTELTAEQLVTERSKYGVPAKRWALRPGRLRNESLDCFGMALAAYRVVCPTAARFEALAAKLEAAAAAAVAVPVAAAQKPQKPRTRSWRR